MSARDELRDPLGWVIAVVAGVVGAIVTVSLGAGAILVGIAIGGVVLGTKVALGGRESGGRKAISGGAQLPKPPRNSSQAQLLQRAGRAFDRLNELADRPSDEWLHARIGLVDDQAASVVDSMSELAGRATVLQSSIAAANPDVLRDDAQRLNRRLQQSSDAALRAELEKTLAAVDGQLNSLARLTSLNETLLSRMHAAAVGLEGLATRAGELVAMGSDAGVNEEQANLVLQELTSNLDTMRAGLLDAEQATRRVV